MRSILSTVSALALALPAGTALAQAVDDAVVGDYYNLGTVIALGGLTPVEAENLGRAVTVITAEELEESNVVTVQDALRSVPGVALAGAGESNTQVRIRGGEGNHTLILIDGIEAGAGDSEYFLSGLDVANVDRIEVLRGPQSAVYGASASAGVINIVTRRATEGRTLDYSVEAGSAYRASAFLAQRSARGGISLALSHLRDRGYDNSGDGGERDEIRRSTAILSGDFALTETLTLDFTLRRSREHYDYDATNSGAADWQGYVVDDPLPYVDRDETTARLGFSHEMLGGRLVQRFSVQTTRNSTSYDGWAPTDTRTDAAHYRLSYGLDGQPVDSADHILTGMLEWEEASSSSNPGYDRRTNSLALEYRGEIGGLSLQAGVRHDRNSAFANATTWTLAASYRFADSGVRVHGSAGTGVVDPSYFELFGNSCYMGSCTYGNAALTPEYNRSFDLGVELPVFGGRGLVDVTLFHSTLTDAIEYYYDAGLGYSTYRNVAGDGTRRGVEISGRLQATDDLSLRLSYTYTDATNPDGSVATRRPEHQLALGATWAFAAGRGSLSADLRYVAGSWDNQWFGAYALAELPAYTTVDLAATYQLTQDVTLIGRVSNLFDEGTMDAWGYPGRGRAAYVGLRARF